MSIMAAEYHCMILPTFATWGSVGHIWLAHGERLQLASSMQGCKCTVGGRIGWIVTRSDTARRPGIPGTTTHAINFHAVNSLAVNKRFCLPWL